MTNDVRAYDVIVFGDEVYGVLAAISAAREYRRRTQKYPKVLLISKANLQEGIGGHLVRGGLSYLDRSRVEYDIRKANNLDDFGDPAKIYQEFLQRSGVLKIALDPNKASAALKDMIREAGIAVLSNFEISQVNKNGNKIVSLTKTNGETFSGKQFIDATVNAELAQAAGVTKSQGFETFGLPDSELPVTLVFTTEGLTVQKLKQIELAYLKRFTNLGDQEAQNCLHKAAGGDANLAEKLRKSLVDIKGNLKTLWADKDYIDIPTHALSIAYHSFRNKKLSLEETGLVFDNANIARFPGDKLSWNALLLAVDANQAEALARNSAKPTPKMLEEIAYVQTWMKSLGAINVTPASELYIRHAGNVTGVVEPLSGEQMLLGGVPANQALGTFGYHFDSRGGILGLIQKSTAKGFSEIHFEPPLFNIGIRHALIKDIPNLAVIGPGSGFQGYGASTGRIVEFNAAVGGGLGIAAIIALLSGRNLADISNQEVRQVLVATNQLPKIYGVAYPEEASKLKQFESQLA